MVAVEAILIFVFFRDVELCDWHFEFWYNEELCGRESSQTLVNAKDGYCLAMMYCSPRRIDS